jgi:hypothetical protein
MRLSYRLQIQIDMIYKKRDLLISFLLRKNLIDHWHHLNQMLGYN